MVDSRQPGICGSEYADHVDMRKAPEIGERQWIYQRDQSNSFELPELYPRDSDGVEAARS